MRDERIQKVLAAQGVCSRRAAEQLIAQGRVKLNGRPVGLGDKMDTAADVLSVDGQRIYVPRKTEKYYYMLHKPRGFITTTSDERGRKTVMDLMEGVPARVYPVGRLDKDSEGLLLLTTDGVVLDDGTKTQPVVIRVVVDEPERTVMEMTLSEGKNRQIRRMCEAVGLEVARLRRTAVGPVKLGMLAPGQFRQLDKQEVRALRTMAQKGKATAQIEKNTRRRAAGTARGPRAPKGAEKRGNRP